MARSSSLSYLVAFGAMGAIAVGAVGCNKRAEPGARSKTAQASAPIQQNAEVKAAAAQLESEGKAANTEHGKRKKAGIEVGVFTDGKAMGVLRFGELPRSVQLVAEPDMPKGKKLYYRLQDYLASVGTDVANIQVVHLRDLREKVVTIQGSELRAPDNKDRFLFAFMAGTTGISHTHWSTEGLQDQLHIDDIALVNVYVKNTPAFVDTKRHCYVKDGACTGELPSDIEVPKGTRVYLDGRFMGYVKRRSMGDSLIVARLEDGSFKYSLAKFAASVGVNDAEISAVEMTSGDDSIARLDAKGWLERRDQYAFTLGQHQHGKAKILLGADVQAAGDEPLKDETVELTSLQFFRSAKGTPHSLTPIAQLDLDGPPPAEAAN